MHGTCIYLDYEYCETCGKLAVLAGSGLKMCDDCLKLLSRPRYIQNEHGKFVPNRDQNKSTDKNILPRR